MIVRCTMPYYQGSRLTVCNKYVADYIGARLDRTCERCKTKVRWMRKDGVLSATEIDKIGIAV